MKMKEMKKKKMCGNVEMNTSLGAIKLLAAIHFETNISGGNDRLGHNTANARKRQITSFVAQVRDAWNG